MIKEKEKRKGFTLIELLVVVLIIGVLAAIALPHYRLAIDKSRYSTMMALVKSIKNEQELFYFINNKYADNFEELGLEILPGGFELSESKYTANYNDYSVSTINFSDRYVYGYMFKPRMSFLIKLDFGDSDYKGRIQCWSYGYPQERERANRVCKSLTKEEAAAAVYDGYEIWKIN